MCLWDKEREGKREWYRMKEKEREGVNDIERKRERERGNDIERKREREVS